jgi:hypothetical protein
MRSASFWSSLTALVAIIACDNLASSGPTCGPGNIATTSLDWVYATNVEAGLYFASVDPSIFTFAGTVDSTPQASIAATAVAQAVGTNFPQGCAIALAAQNVVTFNFNDCSGPLGITNLSGIVMATIDTTGNGRVQAQLTGTHITSNGAIFDLNTSAVATLSANGQTILKATSMSTGTGPNGNSIAHAGSYTVVWPTSPNCATIDATFFGGLTDASTIDASSPGTPTLDAVGVTTTTVNSYVACTGLCPQSGTTTSSLNGQSVTLTFTGFNTAECTVPTGQGGLPIKCG